MGTTSVFHLVTSGQSPRGKAGCSNVDASLFLCLAVGEASLGPDSQNTYTWHLHVEEILIAFYDLTWLPQRVTAAVFCSSGK